jgi:3-oxoacyl-[acyl-carrier-protein] synthase-3
MPHSAIGPIAIHLPETVETIDQLAVQFPRWDVKQIREKTGIWARHIAQPDECASDLGVAAAEKLFAEHQIDRESINFLLFCTQTPDYLLPTTSCLMQERLGLPKTTGALDFNLGCSGYVYGLALADGLIQSGAVHRVLLITAETYTKYIDPTDRSLRTIFGDGAAATLVTASEEPSLGNFVFGTDGRGGNFLMAIGGGTREPERGIQPSKRRRWPSSLFMDGPELVKFSLEILPPLIDRLLEKANWTRDHVDLYLMHQATTFMIKHLRDRINLSEEKTPEALEMYGNTVSSTIPILINDLRAEGRLKPGKQTLLLGFGVGLSWAGCTWTETWNARQTRAEQGETSAPKTPEEGEDTEEERQAA